VARREGLLEKFGADPPVAAMIVSFMIPPYWRVVAGLMSVGWPS